MFTQVQEIQHTTHTNVGSGVNEVAARIEASAWRRGESTVGEFSCWVFFFFYIAHVFTDGL